MLNAAQKTNLSVTWILGGLATLTVLARVYVRFIQQRNPGWDDYAMLLSWVFFLSHKFQKVANRK